VPRVTAAASLQETLVAELVQHFGGERVPGNGVTSDREVKIDGETVHVSYSDSDNHVSIWMERGEKTARVVKYARHMDSVLATRRWDTHFLDDVAR
jgi:hypothetical protein